jgi:hypothetical protein
MLRGQTAVTRQLDYRLAREGRCLDAGGPRPIRLANVIANRRQYNKDDINMELYPRPIACCRGSRAGHRSRNRDNVGGEALTSGSYPDAVGHARFADA